MSLFVSIACTDALSTASLPSLLPNLSISVCGRTADTFQLTNTYVVGTTRWFNGFFHIPIDRTDLAHQYRIQLLPSTSAGSTTMRIMGAYINFYS
jgi:hypothetical protein